jgi:hypothetical protein
MTVEWQELLGPLDSARDDVPVRRQPGGRLELPREMVGAEVGGRRHLLQGQAGVEVPLDGLDDGAEPPPPRPRAVPPPPFTLSEWCGYPLSLAQSSV